MDRENQQKSYDQALQAFTSKVLLQGNKAWIDKYSEGLQFVLKQLGTQQEQLNTPHFLKNLKTATSAQASLLSLTPIKAAIKLTEEE